MVSMKLRTEASPVDFSTTFSGGRELSKNPLNMLRISYVGEFGSETLIEVASNDNCARQLRVNSLERSPSELGVYK